MGTLLATKDEPIVFWPICDPTGRPKLSESPLKNLTGFPYLIANLPGWQEWKDYSLHTTVESFVCVVSIALALTLVLLCVVLCKERPWRPLLILVSVLFSAIHMALVLDNVISSLRSQYELQGGYSLTWLFNDILTTKIRITNFVSSTLLLAAQLQLVALRLVDRKTERAIVWGAGGAFFVAATTLLALVWFYRSNDAILFACQYLLSMGLDVLYFLMAVLYTLSHQQAAFNRDMFIYTLFALAGAALPVALYMADILGWWTARSVDHVCSFSTVAALVLADIWASHLDRYRTKQAHGNIMGRRLYNPDKELVFTESDEHTLLASEHGSSKTAQDSPPRTASAPVHTHNRFVPPERPATT